MNIATLLFTPADQRVFARLSGDFNPVHQDPIVARRTVAGEPIVHGVHLLLRALEAHFESRRQASTVAISARFEHPATIGDAITVERHRRTNLSLTLDGTLRLVDVTVDTRAAAPVHAAAGAIQRGRARFSRRPRVRALEDIAGASGAIPLADRRSVRRAFPRAARALGADAVAAFAAISRLVGMECPGRDSLLSAVSLCVTSNERASDLIWRVSRADPRFGLVRMEVRSGGVRGTVDAFVTPPPVPAPSFEAVADRVTAGEFAGQRAVIVGGSRGLGAVTALIVAAGGGAPLVTFATGRADAARLRRSAARLGRRIDVTRFDVLEDPAARLTQACARFRPTHLYYFATPRIFRRRRDPFDDAVFQRFARFYVSALGDVCAAVRSAVPSLNVFYPSTTAIDLEPVRDLTEYAAAKAAGEALCRSLNHTMPGVRILVRRLPRVTTDQTATILPIQAHDPLTVLLPIVRDMQRASGGPGR
jgi:acyl dehydratase/NAD(P)-dependent dehydrogenase (short-subunit alcohol dehydrogenase family)